MNCILCYVESRDQTVMSRNAVTQGFGAGEKFETRLLIPSKMGGAVIGKKGCNIQQLRSDYNAMIR